MNSLVQIQREAAFAEHGAPRMELYKRGWQEADREKNYNYQMQFRLDYMAEATFYDDAMLSNVVFPELLKLHDEHAAEKGFEFDRFDFDVMWHYKWVVENARDFYQISQKQFYAFAEDFKRRCLALGYSLRTYYEYIYVFSMYGNRERAAWAMEKFNECKRDRLSDCPACEKDIAVLYYLTIGERAKADEASKELFEGRLKCSEVPEVTYGQYLRYDNFRLCEGKTEFLEEARKVCERVKNGVTRRKIGLEFVGDILLCYALTKDAKGLPFYKKYWSFFEENRNPAQRFYFALGAARFFGNLLERKTYRMKLPVNHPFYQESGSYDVEKLVEYYQNQAKTMGERLDARNESSYFAGLYATVFGEE